jgi:hypothetical protein
MRCGVEAQRIHNNEIRWRRVVSITIRPVYPQGENIWYPLDKRSEGSQGRLQRDGEETADGTRTPFVQSILHPKHLDLRLFYPTISIIRFRFGSRNLKS